MAAGRRGLTRDIYTARLKWQHASHTENKHVVFSTGNMLYSDTMPRICIHVPMGFADTPLSLTHVVMVGDSAVRNCFPVSNEVIVFPKQGSYQRSCPECSTICGMELHLDVHAFFDHVGNIWVVGYFKRLSIIYPSVIHRGGSLNLAGHTKLPHSVTYHAYPG